MFDNCPIVYGKTNGSKIRLQTESNIVKELTELAKAPIYDSTYLY